MSSSTYPTATRKGVCFTWFPSMDMTLDHPCASRSSTSACSPHVPPRPRGYARPCISESIADPTVRSQCPDPCNSGPAHWNDSPRWRWESRRGRSSPAHREPRKRVFFQSAKKKKKNNFMQIKKNEKKPLRKKVKNTVSPE